MSKRVANSTLTRDNWDDEEIPEEMGEFQKASESELKMRVIRRGKRSGLTGESISQSIFKNFTGFSSTNSSSTDSSFNLPRKTSETSDIFPSFISNAQKRLGNGGLGINPSDSSSMPMFNFLSSSTEAKPKKIATPEKETHLKSGSFTLGVTHDLQSKVSLDKDKSTDVSFKITADIPKPLEKCSRMQDSEYLSNIKSLNINFLDWIKSHLDKNMYVDLTPTFEDYSKHLNQIKEECSFVISSKVPLLTEKEKTKSSPTFSFGSISNTNEQGKEICTNHKPAFIDLTSSSNSSGGKNFSFGATSTGNPLFDFGSGTQKKLDEKVSSSDITNVVTSDKNTKTNCDENESDEPPVVEIKEVKENDAVYEQKVKLFYKKDDSFIDKGVGTLFLKPTEGKMQLLVRASTNLGNILLNIILNDSVPAKRVGKNNVLIICIPNPPIDTKSKNPNLPVSILIRVKTSEDADMLLAKIEEHKSR